MMIRSYFFSLFFLSTISVFSQNLNCCKTISDVEKVLEGDWWLKKDSRNDIYRFHFRDNEGFVEVLEELNLPPKAEHTKVVDEFEVKESEVKITLEKDKFYIELVYPFGTVKEPIKALSEKHLIFGSGDSERQFTRDTP